MRDKSSNTNGSKKRRTSRSDEKNLVKEYNDIWMGIIIDVLDEANRLVPEQSGDLRRSSFKNPIQKKGMTVGFEIGYTVPYAADLYEKEVREAGVYIQDSADVKSHNRTYTGKGNRESKTIKVSYPNGRVFPQGKRVVYWKDKANTKGRLDGKHQFYTTKKPRDLEKKEFWLEKAYKNIYKKLKPKLRKALALPDHISISVNATSNIK
tara:strand:+ start:244 stop:867 length:624 start_codon:yes stop_codon:yes gene_type:complete